MIQKSKIDIKGLNFYYDKKQVIKELNLEIPKNEILAVFGPANSGITTLLRTLNRLCDLTPGARQEGEILLDGKNIFAPDINLTELRRRVGMVFDVPTPLPMSIFDNVALGPRMGGMKSKAAIEDEVEKVLRMSALWDDVKDRLNTPAARLSGGQQQRLCIARVLALEPEVILLDRPCSALDPISTAKIEESLIQLKEQFTIIIAPHTVQQAGRIADRVAFMLMGDLIEQGATEDVFSFPKDKRTNDYLTGRFG
ncbi:phosphate ABC transporter ATP-binding protein [Lachnoclostridium phytofermentans]|uniref:ABC transporter related n=1 Tax=Lachnoclostridium phytofermentans (strain ATCC 700394 / DSM 18823 / ISDg) TaxID=357809 RepID=A9KRG8_LACP7|nr:phosphate ABC transporter ATP-binding protein [Lachnoclostridium phytofermentans]ABX42042.1 ABC transporter related [Lachnoclostridium phytofermentans ISDg]